MIAREERRLEKGKAEKARTESPGMAYFFRHRESANTYFCNILAKIAYNCYSFY